ncbi:hypothetical protein PHLGIDRAFT_125316 [Phlebiopsis gigantea 11061_1 CR5-6]|uniref:Uncharacterized protein n=1 Tax=Phlebiopsis gigantea (strain 11061_1 CR5-6) TaxID=745531 RepID=A0A0C3SCD6_PHLG1|nr:hypothetical protein PHLGIDRAFT_125316 [Phlebiopsis gigantea 11061_1 CR5-6]
MAARSTRSSAGKTAVKTDKQAKSTSKASGSRTSIRKLSQKTTARNESPEDSDDHHESEAYVEQDEEPSEAESINSDNLDDDPPAKPLKRKRGAASSSKSSPRKGASPRKKRKEPDHDDQQDSEYELEEGQEIVGRVVEAPKSGQVPPGQISQNTLNFLLQLKRPECNDREWFKLHEPVYRVAEKEWKDFIESFTDVLVTADPQIPHLPPKDVTHRIYRDVRFSNDKTPYKTGFSASFSRSGRKGIFAAYHVYVHVYLPLCTSESDSVIPSQLSSIRPGESLIAAGSWCPGKNELTTIRNNLLRSSTRLRSIISDPTFVGLFGEAKPHPNGLKQNIFGREDELKNAPKGVSKIHKDIDLLRCRSFAVAHRFTDKQVLQPDFKEELGRLVEILRPFVHCLNDLMTLQEADDSDGEEVENEAETEE